MAPGEASCLRAPSVISVSRLKVDTEKQIKWSPLVSVRRMAGVETILAFNAPPVKTNVLQ